MIDPAYAYCLTTKPEVFATVQAAKDKLTSEEREMIQDLIMEAYLARIPSRRTRRLEALSGGPDERTIGGRANLHHLPRGNFALGGG